MIVTKAERFDQSPNEPFFRDSITKDLVHGHSRWVKQLIHSGLAAFVFPSLLFARYCSPFLTKSAVISHCACTVELDFSVVT